MERALYNGVISGVSLDGERFFYENPLPAWASPPPAVVWVRVLPAQHRPPPRLVGTVCLLRGESGVAVHLSIAGARAGEWCVVTLRQETETPWTGRVVPAWRWSSGAVHIAPPHSGWCRERGGARVNGEAVDLSGKW